jgi:hypothetical protein
MMAGLFELIQSEDPAIQNGLLNFGLSLLQSKGNFGNAVGRAGQAAQLGARDYRQQEALLKRAGLNDQMIQMQLDEARRQQQERESAAQRRMQMEAYLAGLQPVSGITGTAGPTKEAASRVGQKPQIDPIEAIRMLGPDLAQKVIDSQNWGRQEVARTVETPQGVQQLDKFGVPVGGALPRYVAPVQVDRGGSIDFVTPTSGMSLPVGMSPEQKDASARGWANVNLSRQRLEMDRGAASAEAGGPEQAALVKRFGKSSPGFRWKADGSMEAVPGGPADVKASAEGQKAEQRKRNAADQASGVLDIVKEAKSLVGPTTAGVGGWAQALPMTDARKLAGHIETIKANLGFDRLQQMREASPTGGALGQVAVQELNSLQATIAKLDQLQKPSDLYAALEKIEKHYKRWQETMGGSSGGAEGSFGKKVVRTGTLNGRKVVQYDDGSTEYAD